MTWTLPFILLGLSTISTASARDWHVNHEKGSDRNDGSAGTPLRSVALAIKKAQPGDTIHLVKTETPYPAGITFHNRSGEPGKPITLDGHGATMSGAVLLTPSDWKLIKPGLLASSTLLDRPDPAIVNRFFFRFDGKMNRMGRSLKGPKLPWKTPEELRPGEWCWTEEEQTFYLFDLDYLRVGPNFYKAETFENYRSKTGQGANSIWRAFDFERNDLEAGADKSGLPKYPKP